MEGDLQAFLERKVLEYNHPSFIETDPVCIPHLFTRHQDIEIAALFAAIFAWGNRTTIIAKSQLLMKLMDMSPHDYVMHHRSRDLIKLFSFKHRTFNTTDLLYFIGFLRYHYQQHNSLSTAFSKWMLPADTDITNALNGFYNYFFSLEDVPSRTKKHIATPAKKATCKRLNMFLRWMVRHDKGGVDFGIWKSILPSQLICPIDLHVARVARKFQLLERKQTDWHAALELTGKLKTFDPHDPVKYDFALFGLGVLERF
jgi:uncharacterized protein (TIGR02757 family)